MGYKRKYRRTRRGKSRRRRNRRGSRRFARKVAKVLRKKTETKYYDIGAENLQLVHNLGYGLAPTTVTALPTPIFNPWALIQQGTARFNRIGDKISPIGMKINMYLACKADRPNTMFRILVCILPKMFNSALVGNNFDPFQIPNNGILGNDMLFPVDKDKGIKCVYDRLHRMSSTQMWNGAAGKEMTKIVRLWIRRKRAGNIIYDTTSSTIVNKPLAVYVIPYEQFSTITLDNVASCAYFARMYYKDF